MKIYFLYLMLVFIEYFIFNLIKVKLKMINPFTKQIIYINSKHFFLCLACLQLIFLAGLRSYNIGADTSTYLKALEHYKNLPFDQILKAEIIWPFDFEWGYFMLTKLAAAFSLSKTNFLFLIALIIYIPLFMFICKYSENSYISILIYFGLGLFSYSLGIFRQMIAISITFYSIEYIKKNNFVKFIITIFIASLFHRTAFIMIPFYFISKLNLRNIYVIAFFTQIPCLIYGRTILVFLFNLFGKYTSYLGSEHDVIGGSYTMLIIFNIILFASNIYLRKNITSKEEKVWFSSVPVCINLQALSYSFGIFGRIIPYFSIYMIILIPLLISKFFKGKNLIISSIIISLILFGIIYLGFNGNHFVCPYEFAWES